MPKEVNGFTKEKSTSDEIIYTHGDGTLVTAERNRDDTFSATAFVEGTERSVTVAQGVETRDQMFDALVEFMRSYVPEGERTPTGRDARASARPMGGETPTGSDPRASARPMADMDSGLLDKASDRLSSFGEAVEEKFAAVDGQSALESVEGADGGVFDESSRDGPSAFDEFGDDSRGTSPLFDESGRDGPTAFDKLGDDSGGESALFGESGRDGPTAFGRLSDDDDGGLYK